MEARQSTAVEQVRILLGPPHEHASAGKKRFRHAQPCPALLGLCYWVEAEPAFCPRRSPYRHLPFRELLGKADRPEHTGLGRASHKSFTILRGCILKIASGLVGNQQANFRVPTEVLYGLRDSLALSSLLFLCRWRQQSVQAQVHGSRAVVVGPVIGQGDEGESSRSLAATKEFHRVSKFGIVHLA